MEEVTTENESVESVKRVYPYKQIAVSPELYSALKALKNKGDTFTEVLLRLLPEAKP